jgi:hypothetical protein
VITARWSRSDRINTTLRVSNNATLGNAYHRWNVQLGTFRAGWGAVSETPARLPCRRSPFSRNRQAGSRHKQSKYNSLVATVWGWSGDTLVPSWYLPIPIDLPPNPLFDQASLSKSLPCGCSGVKRVSKFHVQLHLTYHLLNDQRIVVSITGCPPDRRECRAYRASFIVPANLLNSRGYSLKLLIVENGNQVIYMNDTPVSFTLADTAGRDQAYMGREPGVVQPSLPWHTERAKDGARLP